MTLYLPGFHLESLRRKPQSARQLLTKKLAELKQKTFSQLSDCFGQFVPKHCLRPSESGALSRQRLFSKEEKIEVSSNIPAFLIHSTEVNQEAPSLILLILKLNPAEPSFVCPKAPQA